MIYIYIQAWIYTSRFSSPPTISEHFFCHLAARVALLSRVTGSSHGYTFSLNPTQRGLLCLVERGVDKDVPALWLATWASPGRLFASLARLPLVRSWWMVVLLVTPEPVETTGTARIRVVPAGLSVVNTCPWAWAFPTEAWEREMFRKTYICILHIQQNTTDCNTKLRHIFWALTCVLEGRTGDFELISCTLKLRPCNRLLAEVATQTQTNHKQSVRDRHHDYCNCRPCIPHCITKNPVGEVTPFSSFSTWLESNHKPKCGSGWITVFNIMFKERLPTPDSFLPCADVWTCAGVEEETGMTPPCRLWKEAVLEPRPPETSVKAPALPTHTHTSQFYIISAVRNRNTALEICPKIYKSTNWWKNRSRLVKSGIPVALISSNFLKHQQTYL